MRRNEDLWCQMTFLTVYGGSALPIVLPRFKGIYAWLDEICVIVKIMSGETCRTHLGELEEGKTSKYHRFEVDASSINQFDSLERQ